MDSTATMLQLTLSGLEGLADATGRFWVLWIALPVAVCLLVSVLAAGLLLREWLRGRRSDGANA
jgi:hypothetical protein